MAIPYRQAFNNLPFNVDEIVIVSVDAGAAAVRFTVSGPRSMVTGVPWKTTGIIELEIQEGKISKETFHYDPRPLIEDRPYDHQPLEC